MESNIPKTCWVLKRKFAGREDYYEAFRLYSPEAVGEVVKLLLTYDQKGSSELYIEMEVNSTLGG